MKKVLMTLAIVLALGFYAQAQYNSSQNDNFFNTWDEVGNGLDKPGGVLPGVPGGHGGSGDVPVPLGAGLLILTALGAGYAIKKKR